MQRDDDPDAGGSPEESPDPESVLPPGPRRSTYVPPPAAVGATGAASPSGVESSIPDSAYDDDLLAAAFAEQTAQIPTSFTTPISTIAPAVSAPQLADLPAPSGKPVLFPMPPEIPIAPAVVAIAPPAAVTVPPAVAAAPPAAGPTPRDAAAQAPLLPPPSPGVQPESRFAPPEVIYELVEPARAAPPVFDFDALVIGPAVVEHAPPAPQPDVSSGDDPRVSDDPPATGEAAIDPFELAGAPVDLSTAEPVPLATGSHTVVPRTVDVERADEVDETDRAFETVAGAALLASAEPPAVTGSAPVQPRATPRVPEGVSVLDDGRPTAPAAFAIESVGLEPTPVDRRVGHAARLFWLWFAANCSILSVAFGAALLSLGMSLKQALLSALIGGALSFLPLGLTTLAGKWSAQPTMVVSRATFGHLGNLVPASLAVLVRVFWGAVLLWLVAVSTAHVLHGAGLGGTLTEVQLSAIVMAAAFIVALVVAILGYGLFSRLQLVLAVVSAVLIVGVIVITWHRVDFRTALTIGDGPWILVITGAVLVFSFVGLVWATSGADLARYQNPSTSGAWSMLWASAGTALPPFVLIAYGAVLAASDSRLATGLVTDPLGSIAQLLPAWYPVPLIAATVLSLFSGLVLSIYSGGFALRAVGLRAHRGLTTVIVGAAVFAVAIVMSVTVSSVVPVFRDFATTLAVPVAAWAGILTAEMILRRRRFDSESLLRRGGVYPDVNWVNLVGLVVASAIGFGLTTATIGWLEWQGYGFRLVGLSLDSELARSDLGVLAALLLGLLTPFALGLRTIRAQERARTPVGF